MKNVITLILIINILVSCNKETNQSTGYETYYVNNSSQRIKIKNLTYTTIEILPYQSYLNSHSSRGIQGDENPVNLNMDTIKIFYNDTVSIKHPGSNYIVNKDIRNPVNYVNEKKEHEYGITFTHTYTFNNADFEEAKTK